MLEEATGRKSMHEDKRRALEAQEKEIVALDPDHPGFRDLDYRARRNAIAKLAVEYREGDPVPFAEYTPEEHDVWRTVWGSLGPVHEKNAVREYLDASKALDLSRDRIPQLSDVDQRVKALSGFRMVPVAGLVTSRGFLSYLAKNVFLSTQYIRHHSVPMYTPEPDIVHELVGHAASLTHPAFVAMNQAFGRAAMRVDEETMIGLANVYWFTVEYGVVLEDGVPKAYGAGLLSSFGELESFAETAELRRFDIEVIAKTGYDPTQYQKILFVGRDFESATREATAWADSLGY
ncbi:MAG: phenylalanine 4-monooxygenase [Clostridia bacterium]|nr:phenylalanine 4-monooxygenase [Deltaproteobacteria bacterium]